MSENTTGKIYAPDLTAHGLTRECIYSTRFAFIGKILPAYLWWLRFSAFCERAFTCVNCVCLFSHVWPVIGHILGRGSIHGMFACCGIFIYFCGILHSILGANNDIDIQHICKCTYKTSFSNVCRGDQFSFNVSYNTHPIFVAIHNWFFTLFRIVVVLLLADLRIEQRMRITSSTASGAGGKNRAWARVHQHAQGLLCVHDNADSTRKFALVA